MPAPQFGRADSSPGFRSVTSQFVLHIMSLSIPAHLRTAFCIAAVSLLVLASSTRADSVVTDVVGFTTTSCLTNSDTLVAMPFTRPQAFVGSVVSVAGSTLTISGSPGWTTNQFVYVAGTQPNHYYVLIGPAGTTNPK